MTKRVIALLLAVILCLGAFSGCKKNDGKPGTDPATTTGQHPAATSEPPATEPPATEPPETTEPPATEPVIEGDVPLRLTNGGARDYAEEGYVDVEKFADMEYAHPDVESICAQLETLTEMAERGDDPDKILEAYYAAADEILNFRTMNNLAYIRYTLNTNEDYYKEEYDAMEIESSDLNEKIEAFCKACAFSPVREALERDYFGYGYFDKYEDYEFFTNPEYLALKKQEDELMAEYRSALQDPQIEYGGKTQSYYDLLAQYEDIQSYADYYTYLDILETFYTTYNQSVGKIYLELVKVRKQEAEVLGYDSYADYCYDYVFERDYTHEQGAEFLKQIRTELVPLAAQIENIEQPQHFPMTQADVEQALRAAVKNIGSGVEEAYRFMVAYDLYDINSAPEKFDSSFTTYLPNFEAPYLTVNSQGTSSDYVTFSHEFGHFVDKFVTYDADEDLETAETFSQSMEFLSLCYTEGVLSNYQVQQLLKLDLIDTLQNSIIFQAALAEFEDSIYALDLSELTLERVNSLYRQYCKDYGFYDSGFDWFYTYRWFEITHIFEAPYYVISYAVSADTALQVYVLEREQEGAGLDAYWRLLERDPDDGVQAVMTAAGLDNPFREGAIADLAAFYRQELGLR